MVAFLVVMGKEFPDGISQGVFTKQDHLIETAFFNSPEEALRKCIQIRRARGQFNGFDTTAPKQAQEVFRIERISIMDKIPLASKAIWLIHKPVAELAMPPISTRRVDKSMKNSTTKRVRPEDVQTSTVKKSLAII